MAVVRNKSHGTILLPHIGKTVKPGGEIEITDEEFEKIKGILVEFKRLGIIDIVKATHVIKMALEEENGELKLRPLDKPEEVKVESNVVVEDHPIDEPEPEQLPGPTVGTVIEIKEPEEKPEEKKAKKKK